MSARATYTKMASTRGNGNINVVVVLCFILLVASSSSAKVPDKKHIKFPPNPNVGAEKINTPANHYYRGCNPITRCRKGLDDHSKP
ncbi:hypothetical protein RND71_027303 [Anisodus tanguticus]|uniref:Uncharacterized protein n=1 Tax=Anisodus tanguticus TaxID=243964 RepID=A0AAE1RGE1_9SOLA|nr:hypothetical protein RND71_027303 [Anisodus tanguticus]